MARGIAKLQAELAHGKAAAELELEHLNKVLPIAEAEASRRKGLGARDSERDSDPGLSIPHSLLALL